MKLQLQSASMKTLNGLFHLYEGMLQSIPAAILPLNISSEVCWTAHSLSYWSH